MQKVDKGKVSFWPAFFVFLFFFATQDSRVLFFITYSCFWMFSTVLCPEVTMRRGSGSVERVSTRTAKSAFSVFHTLNAHDHESIVSSIHFYVYEHSVCRKHLFSIFSRIFFSCGRKNNETAFDVTSLFPRPQILTKAKAPPDVRESHQQKLNPTYKCTKPQPELSRVLTRSSTTFGNDVGIHHRHDVSPPFNKNKRKGKRAKTPDVRTSPNRPPQLE